MNVCYAPLPVVFDLDGTLIDSAADIHLWINKVLQEYDTSDISFEQTRDFIGDGVEVLWNRVIAAKQLDQNLKSPMLARFMEMYGNSVENTQVYPQVREALNELSDRGHPLGLCTNKPSVPTQKILKELGLDRMFGAIVCGDTLAVRKPDPAPLIKALAELGENPDNPRGYFVGDSEIDGACAGAAGVEFLLFTQGYAHVPLESIPHVFAFDRFDALAPAIAQLGGR